MGEKKRHFTWGVGGVELEEIVGWINGDGGEGKGEGDISPFLLLEN